MTRQQAFEIVHAHNDKVRDWRKHGLLEACKAAGLAIDKYNRVSGGHVMRAMAIDWEQTKDFVSSAFMLCEVLRADGFDAKVEMQTGYLRLDV